MTTAPTPNSYVAIVDDDSAIRSALGRALRMENYDVELFEDGTTALKSIQLRAPDAIVLDLQLPDIDGLEICRRIRRSGDTTPILMLTARNARVTRMTSDVNELRKTTSGRVCSAAETICVGSVRPD